MSRDALLTDALLTGAMLALGGLAWVMAGWLLETLTLSAFDLPGRVLLVFVVLGLAEAALQRLRPSKGENHG